MNIGNRAKLLGFSRINYDASEKKCKYKTEGNMILSRQIKLTEG